MVLFEADATHADLRIALAIAAPTIRYTTNAIPQSTVSELRFAAERGQSSERAGGMEPAGIESATSCLQSRGDVAGAYGYGDLSRVKWLYNEQN